MQKTSIILLSSLVASPAFAASSTTMTNNSILIFIGLMAFTCVNAIAQASCYFAGLYVQKSVSQKHVTLSLVFPLIALIGFIAEYQSLAQFILYLGAVLLGFGAALVPLLLTNKKVPCMQSALILLTGAIIILPLSIIIAPISLFSIVLCHLALKQTAVAPIAKLSIILTLLTSYGLFAYWLFQIFNKITLA
ncbi:hypothetical protein AB4140_08395 [Shewanella sp. 10N.286.51.B2]|uniref:hypothetical protein n=1 Tax=Shewanella sp. 10N.286.51.B2 TaxID=3229707 RepID=UPI00355004EC